MVITHSKLAWFNVIMAVTETGLQVLLVGQETALTLLLSWWIIN